MKKLLVTMVLGALVLTASFVSADPRVTPRPPDGVRQIWRCQQEDQAKQDKAFKDFEDECAKYLETMVGRKRQPSRSF